MGRWQRLMLQAAAPYPGTQNHTHFGVGLDTSYKTGALVERAAVDKSDGTAFRVQVGLPNERTAESCRTPAESHTAVVMRQETSSQAYKRRHVATARGGGNRAALAATPMVQSAHTGHHHATPCVVSDVLGVAHGACLPQPCFCELGSMCNAADIGTGAEGNGSPSSKKCVLPFSVSLHFPPRRSIQVPPGALR